MSMDIWYITEILIYELIDLFPNLILAVTPFRDSLRFSRVWIVCFSLILYCILCFSRIFALGSLPAAAILSTLMIGLYFGFYYLCVKASLSKLLFILLTILNYTSLVAILFSHFAFHVFSQSEDRPYSLYSTAIVILVYALSYPFIYCFFFSKLKTLISFPENNSYWRFLWLVPATFCLSYYYNLFANGGIIAFSESISNVLFAVFFNLGALFITYLIMQLLSQINDTMELKAENYQLNMRSIQYENLALRLEDARRAKHDLRQTLTVIQSCLIKNDHEELLKYINSYLNSFPPDSPIIYCDNYAVNALIVYYAYMAQTHNVLFDAKAVYPAESGIADTDAVTLLGNLLENAVESCLRQQDEKAFITLRIKSFHKMLVITLDNSYTGSIQKNGEFPLSSKTGRDGVGTASIKNITKKYNGTMKLQYGCGQFHVSVMLRKNL